jgi:hypothetical protein
LRWVGFSSGARLTIFVVMREGAQFTAGRPLKEIIYGGAVGQQLPQRDAQAEG